VIHGLLLPSFPCPLIGYSPHSTNRIFSTCLGSDLGTAESRVDDAGFLGPETTKDCISDTKIDARRRRRRDRMAKELEWQIGRVKKVAILSLRLNKWP
jgi:hypothetical protein